jgi:D-glycero-D-manno-heptose 1,7-bisphosphate phosphatase
MMTKYIFLDRDGVINEDPMVCSTDREYVTGWEYFHFLPGAIEAIRDLTRAGYKVVILSNQAGVGKGVYSKERLDGITKKMLSRIEENGGRIHSVQYCIHRKEDACDCRKPKTGLFTRALKGAKIDFSKAYFVGDTKRDIEAGNKIGCKTVLVLSGKTKEAKENLGWDIAPDVVKKDLKEAVEFILGVP